MLLFTCAYLIFEGQSTSIGHAFNKDRPTFHYQAELIMKLTYGKLHIKHGHVFLVKRHCFKLQPLHCLKTYFQTPSSLPFSLLPHQHTLLSASTTIASSIFTGSLLAGQFLETYSDILCIVRIMSGCQTLLRALVLS